LADDNKVTPLGNTIARLTPEMQIRWMMSNMDRIDTLAFVLRIKDEHPIVSVSSNCSQYFLSLASAILNREALKGVTNENGPYKGPQEEKK